MDRTSNNTKGQSVGLSSIDGEQLRSVVGGVMLSPDGVGDYNPDLERLLNKVFGRKIEPITIGDTTIHVG